MDIKIIGINLAPVRPDKPNKWRSIARFDVEIGSVRLFGCRRLMLTMAGNLIAFPPAPPNGLRPVVAFVDQKTSDMVAEQAGAAYRAMGGTEIPEGVPTMISPAAP